MNTINQIRPSDVFTDYGDFQYDRILKRLPADLSESTIEKYNSEEILNIMFGIKTIIAFGAVNTGKKLLKMVKNRIERLPEKELLLTFKKELIILLGIMHDIHMSDEIFEFISSFGSNIQQMLESDRNFKFLWAMVLTEIKTPNNDLALALFKDLQNDEHLAPSSRDFSRVKFLRLMLDKKIVSPESIIQTVTEIEKSPNTESSVYLSDLKAHAYFLIGEQKKAHDNASKVLQKLSSSLVKLNYDTRLLINDIEKNLHPEKNKSTSIDNAVLLKLYPKLEHRVSSKRTIENELEEVYVIKKNNIRIATYKEIEHDKKDNVLDLVSGYYRSKNRKLFLSKNRTLAMKAIISMGPIGIKDILIGEYVFLDQNIRFTSLRKRSQDLVTQLQKIELPIIRKDNTIFYDFENSPLTLIAGADEYRGEIAYLKLKHSVINKKIVTYELMTKPSTSSLYLKQWREEKKITPTNDPYGDYRFN